MLARASLAEVLAGTRNRPAADLHAIASVLTRVSQLLVDRPEIVEIRIDPLVCDDKDAMALETQVRVAPGKNIGTEHLAVAPYPKHLGQPVALGGRRYLLRPIRPEDARLYTEFIAGTESRDIHFRYFSPTRDLPAKDLVRYTQTNYDRDMAFVAVAASNDDREEIVGEIRAFRYPDGATVEFTLLVRSDMKRRGLGSALMEKMIAYCRASGVREIIGQILPHNEAMIELARKFGMSVSRHPEASTAVAYLDVRAMKSGKGTHSQDALSS